MENLITVILLSAIFVQGKLCKEGDPVEVKLSEARDLIGRGIAVDETVIDIEEEGIAAVEDMELDELYAYAKEIYGNKINKKMNKEEIIDFINGDEG